MGIAQEIDQQYITHAQFQPYPTDGDLAEYVSTLPKFQDKTIIEIIGERLSQKQQVSLLDIGCGKGIFLCELVVKFPQIQVSGISAFNYRDFLDDPYLTYIKKVDYRVGDAHRLRQVFAGSQFDLVTSINTFPYLANPSLVLDQAYSLLKSGGLAFIDTGVILHS